MKTKLILFLTLSLFFITSVQLNSCISKDEVETSEVNDAIYNSLYQDLNDYNRNFILNNPIEDKDHSRFLGFNKFIKAIKADFLAAGPANPNDEFLRIIALSPSASRKKWKEENAAERDQIIDEATSLALNNLLNTYIDSLSQFPNNIGYAHNAVVLKMYVDGRTNFNSTEQLAHYTYHAIHSLNISSTNPTQSDIDELTNKINQICDTIIQENDSLTFVNLRSRFPTLYNRLNIFENYCTNVSNYNEINDIRSYTSGFLNVINASQLSTLEKAALGKSIALYPKSYHMWTKLDSIMSN